MKKSLIALAVLAASGAAMAQSSVTLFGIVDTGVGYVKNSGSKNMYDLQGQNKSGMANSGNATSRLGFRGVEDLGGGLKAGFWLEGEVFPDTGAKSLDFQRRSTVSLAGAFGEVRLGREQVAGYSKVSTYDMFGQVGMGQFLGWSAGLYSDPTIKLAPQGDLTGVRASNMVSYYTPNMGGFHAAVSYAFGENHLSNKTNRYVGGYAAYDNGPLSATLALDKNNGDFNVGADADAFALNVDRTQVAFGASYDLGMAKISGLVQQVKFKDTVLSESEKFNNWMLGASAPVGPGTIKAQYASYKLKGSDNKAHQFSLGYVYDMSKRTAVYGTASYLKNKGDMSAALGGRGLDLSAVNGKAQTGFQVGVRHAF